MSQDKNWLDKKDDAFFKGLLMCEVCWQEKAAWIEHYGMHLVYCEGCRDNIDNDTSGRDSYQYDYPSYVKNKKEKRS